MKYNIVNSMQSRRGYGCCQDSDINQSSQVQFELKVRKNQAKYQQPEIRKYKIKRTFGKIPPPVQLNIQQINTDLSMGISQFLTQTQTTRRISETHDGKKTQKIRRTFTGSADKYEHKERNGHHANVKFDRKHSNQKETKKQIRFVWDYNDKLNETCHTLRPKSKNTLRYVKASQINLIPSLIQEDLYQTYSISQNGHHRQYSSQVKYSQNLPLPQMLHASCLKINQTDSQAAFKLQNDLVMLAKELNNLELEQLHLEKQKQYTMIQFQISLSNLERIRSQLQKKAQTQSKEIDQIQKLIKQFKNESQCLN